MRWILCLAALLLSLSVSLLRDDSGTMAPAASGMAWKANPARLTQAELNASPAAIDALVLARLKQDGLTPAPPIDDETFLHRASLDLIGRIPNPEERAAFLALPAATRREAQVERLLRHPGHALHRLGFYGDLFRLQTRVQNRYTGHPFHEWLYEQAALNTPWDKLVTAMLTASGSVHAPGNGATGFWVRDTGMPLDRVSHEVQALLGTRVGCAQCHDHPYDSWTRQQFFSIAAHTAGSRVDANRYGMSRALALDLRRAVDKETPQTRNVMRGLSLLLYTHVKPGAQPSLPLPDDYQYPDAKPGTRIVAAPMWSEDPLPPTAGGDPRIAWAAWITDDRNPRFAAVIANRLWKRLFGYALVEPVDAWLDSTVPSDPPLMDLLTRIMISVDYDLDRFERILTRTQAWQRAAVNADTGTVHRPGPLRRRLSAEQIWDSLVAMSQPRPEAAGLDEFTNRMREFAREYTDIEPLELLARARSIADRGTSMSRERTTATPARRAEIDQEMAKVRLAEDLLRSTRRPDSASDERAAYQQQPAVPGHALRIFGQSDRELIDNGSTQPNVTQALAMINGPIERLVSGRKTSTLMQHLLAIPDPQQRIAAAWIAVLGRPPSTGERRRAEALLAADAATGTGDVAWLVLASTEFLFSR